MAFDRLGTLTVRQRSARTGRNPQTGEALQIPAKKTVGLKVSKVLKDALNGAAPYPFPGQPRPGAPPQAKKEKAPKKASAKKH